MTIYDHKFILSRATGIMVSQWVGSPENMTPVWLQGALVKSGQEREMVMKEMRDKVYRTLLPYHVMYKKKSLLPSCKTFICFTDGRVCNIVKTLDTSVSIGGGIF